MRCRGLGSRLSSRCGVRGKGNVRVRMWVQIQPGIRSSNMFLRLQYGFGMSLSVSVACQRGRRREGTNATECSGCAIVRHAGLGRAVHLSLS